jgi:hypothetical protein
MMQSDSSSERPAGRAPTPQNGGDDSGLHDIRALAETTQRRSRRQPTVDPDDALLTTSSTSLRAIALPQPARTVALPVAPAAAHAPAPARPARTAEGSAPVPREAAPMARRTVWIAGGGLAGAAVVAAIVVTGGGGAPVAPVAVAPPAPVPAVVPIPPQPEPQPRPEPAPAPAATAPATVPATETASPTASLTTHQDSPPGGGARVSPTTEATSAKPTPRPAPARPAAERAAPAPAPVADKPATPKGGSQTLDDLLEGASGGAQRSAGGAAAPAAPVKRELGRGDIKDAMTGVQGAARACYDRFGVAGTVGVKLVVAPSGSVSKVQATGTFAGTPTGDCVAAAVQRAQFPAWEGAPMTVQYSFLLSE